MNSSFEDDPLCVIPRSLGNSDSEIFPPSSGSESVHEVQKREKGRG